MGTNQLCYWQGYIWSIHSVVGVWERAPRRHIVINASVSISVDLSSRHTCIQRLTPLQVFTHNSLFSDTIKPVTYGGEVDMPTDVKWVGENVNIAQTGGQVRNTHNALISYIQLWSCHPW